MTVTKTNVKRENMKKQTTTRNDESATREKTDIGQKKSMRPAENGKQRKRHVLGRTAPSTITNLRKEERFTIRFHFEVSLNACLRSCNNGNYSETPKTTEMPSLGRVISKAF